MVRVLKRITTGKSSTLRSSSTTFSLLPEGRESRLRSSNSERLLQEAGEGPVNPGSPPCLPEKKPGKLRLAKTIASADRSAGSGSLDVETHDLVRESVGYGKPPRHSRFKPGQSGTPKGRAKNIKNFPSILKEELETLVEVTENGRRRKLSKGQLAIKGLVLKAVKGDHRAVAEVFRQMEKHFQPPNERQTSPGTSDEEASAMSPMRHLILEYFAPNDAAARLDANPRESHPAEVRPPRTHKEAKS